jgi:phosphate transport system permease protein
MFSPPSTRPTERSERALELVLLMCGLVTLATTAGLLFVLVRGTTGLFAEVPLADFLAPEAEVGGASTPAFLGIWPLITGTLLTCAIALAVAVPLGVLSAIYLAEFATPKLRRIFKPTLEILAGLPTLVFGYFALMFLTPMLDRVVPGLAPFNALSPGLVMGVMIVPMIASLSEDAIHGVARSSREAAWALGADELQTIVRVVLPTAFTGIAAAVVLAVSRAIGETMIVTIAAGRHPALTLDPRVPIETMTTYMVEVSTAHVAAESVAYRTMFAVGAALFVLTFVTNFIAQRLTRRFRPEAT